MTKKDVYVVVDTPKKAKKLKKVLDMFGEKLNRVDVDAIKIGHYYGSAKLYTEYNKSYFNGISWTLMDICEDCEDKTEVSIKELRTILAKEHLKVGDYVIVDVFGIGEIESISGSYFEIDDETFHFDNFKRYATPEEIELLEGKKDKFAELKEAYKNGAVIQWRREIDGKLVWKDCHENDPPTWRHFNEYRIKPEEKPKLQDSDIATIEALHDVLLDNHKYDINSKLLSNARNLCYKINAIINSED